VPKEFATSLFHVTLEDGSDVLSAKRVNDLEALSRYNVTVFEFTLKRLVSEKSKRTFTLVEHYYNRFQMLPKKITLTEDQLVVFDDDVFFYSPYHVDNQQTHFETKRLM
jgi:Ribophorin I